MHTPKPKHSRRTHTHSLPKCNGFWHKRVTICALRDSFGSCVNSMKFNFVEPIDKRRWKREKESGREGGRSIVLVKQESRWGKITFCSSECTSNSTYREYQFVWFSYFKWVRTYAGRHGNGIEHDELMSRMLTFAPKSIKSRTCSLSLWMS